MVPKRIIKVKTNVKITSSFNSTYHHCIFNDDSNHHLHKTIDVGKKINLLLPIPSVLQLLLTEPVLLLRFCPLDLKLIYNFCLMGLLLPEQS